MAEVTKASRVSYTKEDVQREATEEKLADKIWVALVVDEWVSTEQDPTNGEGPGVDLIGRPKLTVLNPENLNERTKWTVYHRMCMPLRHPDYLETHVPPAWAKRNWFEFARAVLPNKHPDEPRYDKKSKTWSFKGKKVERSEVDDIKKSLIDPLLDEAVKAYNDDGKEMIGKVLYAQTKHNGDFVNIVGLRDHLPEDGEYMGPASLASKKELTTRAVKKAGGNGSTGRARPAKTGGSKKKTGSRRRR